MLFKYSYCYIFLQFSFLLANAQSNDADHLLLICTTLSHEYNIYEINGRSFSFPTYGQALMIRPKHIITGKQYFRKKSLPDWLTIKSGMQKKLPEGTVVRPFRGDCVSVDTFLYQGIRLKYPVEINGEIYEGDTSKDALDEVIIINKFRLVKECSKYPFKHFEAECAF